MPDIVGIGASVCDTLLTLAAYPREDTKCHARARAAQGGGPCATALVAAAKLGVSCAFMGVLGTDGAGDFMRAEMEQYGVDCTAIVRKRGASHSAVVLLNEANGSRTCVCSACTTAPLAPGELNAPMLRGARFLHLDGNELAAALAAARLCRAAGVKVSLDAGGNYPGIGELLPYVDVLIPSEEFARAFTGRRDTLDAARALAQAYHPETLIVTQGARGGFLLANGACRRYPCFPVAAKDTNGAGDVFHGGYLAGQIFGYDEYHSAVFASAVSAVKCMGLGARRSAPDLEQTLFFLRERGVFLSPPGQG